MLSVRAGDALVGIDWAGIRAAIQRFGEEYDDVYLVFRPSAPWPAAVDAGLLRTVGEAVEVAEERSRSRVADGTDRHEVGAQSPELSPHGPVLWFDDPGADGESRTFLTEIAEHLAAGGWSGTLGPFTELDVPDPMYDRVTPSKLTVFGSFSMRDAETVAREALTWCTALSHDVTRLDVGVNSIALPAVDPADYLVATLQLGLQGGITCWRDGEEPARRVVLAAGRDGGPGVASWQEHGAPADWRAQLGVLIAGMTHQAALFELLAVRREPRWAQVGWGSYDVGEPRPPFLAPGDLLRNPHLLDRWTPDAHGAQVLSDAHLEKASDLNGWSVETICPGRHLVLARDLGEWFAGEQPSARALEAGRCDFGSMILRPQPAPSSSLTT